MDEIKLKNATIADLALLIKMETQCFSDPWSKNVLESELKNPLTSIWLVEAHGRVVGYAFLSVILDEANINNIAILPEERGHGYGQWLLAHLIQIAKRRGVRVIMLEVRTSNTIAKKLYENNGFSYVAKREKYYNDGEDADIMWLHY